MTNDVERRLQAPREKGVVYFSGKNDTQGPRSACFWNGGTWNVGTWNVAAKRCRIISVAYLGYVIIGRGETLSIDGNRL
jgi:hypothetical protein